MKIYGGKEAVGVLFMIELVRGRWRGACERIGWREHAGHVEGCCPAGSKVLHRDQSEAEDKKGEGSEELGSRERLRSGAES